nr:hypothetical protein [Streptomyces liliiviolaceus]
MYEPVLTPRTPAWRYRTTACGSRVTKSRSRPPGHGVVSADSADAALERIAELLGSHRVWDRFTQPV